jgi:hypothetical protein
MQGISTHHMRYMPAQHTLEKILQDSTQHQTRMRAPCEQNDKQRYTSCMGSMKPGGKQKHTGSSPPGGWLLSCFGCVRPAVSMEPLTESLRCDHDSSSSDWSSSIQQAASCSWNSSGGGSNSAPIVNSSVDSSSISKAIKAAGAGSTQEVPLASQPQHSMQQSCPEVLHISGPKVPPYSQVQENSMLFESAGQKFFDRPALQQ